ncbi:MAG: tRNA pseudouridine(13) synthase TruD [Gammaproteobacteria bacterium]
MSEAATPAAWIQIAFDPPRAFGDPPLAGRIRATPEDFTVEERLGYEPDGGRAHRLVRVEKRGLNTLEVARELAAAAGCHPAEVGFAGMKDRCAVARQWFSVPAERARPPEAGHVGTGFRVLESRPHSRKLRRGALAGNAFTIRVRDLGGDPAGVASRLARLTETGFPNYFGPQRFGTGGANLARVQSWVAGGRLPRGREARAFLLSTARALAFQSVLAQRVQDGSWNRLLPGEIVNLAASHSVFAAGEVDADLEQRCRWGDLNPTGPLPGEGGLAPGGEAARVERDALAAIASIPQSLAAAGMRAERRALVARPAALAHCREGADLVLTFELPRGCYATCLLREILAVEADEPGVE